MRLIDADLLKDSLRNLEATGTNIKYVKGLQDAIDGYFPQIIDDAPTVDAEPVKHGRWHGRWIEKNDWIVCSNCNHDILDDYYEKRYKYIACPYCGAKMEVENEK